MGFWEHFPYTNFHNLNLEWILDTVKKLDSKVALISDKIDSINPVAPLNAINVLNLGFKNDGSEDISELFNRYTVDSALLFPPGLYRVDKPLYAVNSVYGFGIANGYDSADRWKNTYLLSTIETDSDRFGVLNVSEQAGNIVVNGISIFCHSKEKGVKIAYGGQNEISNVNVMNCASVGFSAESVSSSSKIAMFDHCNVFGVPNEATVGFYFNQYSADCRISNSEAMMVQRGIMTDGVILYIANMHIWTSFFPSNAVMNPDWFSQTCGILALGNAKSIFATNLYIDTARIFFQSLGNAVFNITNLISWNDGTADVTGYNDGVLLLGGKISVSGGRVYTKNTQSNMYALPNSYIENLYVITDHTSEEQNFQNILPLTPVCSNKYYHLSTNPTKYSEIATVIIDGYGSVVCRVIDSSGNICKFALSNHASAFIAYKISEIGEMNLFFKDFGEGSIKIFTTGAAAVDVEIETSCVNAHCLIYPLVQRLDNGDYTREVYDTDAGLTAFQEKV